eukprot:scaffold23202_cov18-Tisochrysis_lutea.AAC.1
MDIFCAVGTVKQTEQPNYLAEAIEAAGKMLELPSTEPRCAVAKCLPHQAALLGCPWLWGGQVCSS